MVHTQNAQIFHMNILKLMLPLAGTDLQKSRLHPINIYARLD
jgi:hypothetical protein